MTQQLLTITAYAASRGIDKSTISRQVKAGQIPVVNVPGRKWSMIDPVTADDARAKNIDSAKRSPRVVVIARTKTVTTPEPVAQADDEKSVVTLAPSLETGDDYTAARTTSVELDIKRKKIELMKMMGELVLKRDVEDAAQKAARMMRDHILAAADDLAEGAYNSDSINTARTNLRVGLRRVLEVVSGSSLTASKAEQAQAV